jgi:hypothetical protein
MNRRSILTKTGKGLMEATGKTSNLSRDLRNILKEIDGKVSVSELSEKFEKMSEAKLLEALGTMEREGYVREFVGKQDEGPRTPAPRGPASQSFGEGSDLDFTSFTPAKPNAKANEEARLQAQAQEIARQAQATRAREEAAAKAKAEAVARARAEADLKARKQQAAVTKPGSNLPLPPLINPTVAPAAPAAVGILGAGPEAQARAQADALARAQAIELERARREAEEKARRDAEERARREAAEKAKREAEERAKREAEERRLREIAERTRREEEERARREAEARAKREAEERARREAEERIRRELEERTRREVAERLRREEDERRRREEEERARREAERQARIEAETKARVDAELRAKREAEERVRREEEERRQAALRKPAEDEERKRREREEAETLERSLREAQEKAQREEEEGAEREEAERIEPEERAAAEEEGAERLGEDEEERQREEEEYAREETKRARREEKEQARAAAKARKAARSRERAGEEAWRGDEEALREEGSSLSAAEIWEKRKPRSALKTLGVLVAVVLVAGVAVLPFVPLASAPYEKSAQAWLDQPVKIGTVNLTLLPLPQLKFEKVVIGRDPQMKVGVVKASPDVFTLLDDRIAVRSLELDNVTLPRGFLVALLQDRSPRRGLGAQRITAKGLRLDEQDLGLPPLDLDASLSPDGALRSASFSNSEQRLSIQIEPHGGKAAVNISSGTLPLPIGIDFGLTEFAAKGTVSATELILPNAEARAFGGRIFGNLHLRWSSGWNLDGDLSARQMEAKAIAGPLLGTGTVLGKGRLSMRGLLPERMILNSQLEGSFSVQKGSVSNVDMTRLLQGSGSGGGTTIFSELTGDFSADPNRLLVRNIRLAAGLLTGVGQLEMDPQKNLSGRMQIELRAQSVQARSTLGVSGTLVNPQFRRTN